MTPTAPDNPVPTCFNCGRTVEPFGTMRQLFYREDEGYLCLGCARQLVPSNVAIAEEYEARLSQSEQKPE